MVNACGSFSFCAVYWSVNIMALVMDFRYKPSGSNLGETTSLVCLKYSARKRKSSTCPGHRDIAAKAARASSLFRVSSPCFQKTRECAQHTDKENCWYLNHRTCRLRVTYRDLWSVLDSTYLQLCCCIGSSWPSHSTSLE